MATACRPATPAPSTSVFAGGTVTAAVISIGKNRETGRPQQHRLVPGDRRLRRQRIHRLRARDPRDRLHRERDDAARRRRSTPAVSVSGSRNPISTCPSRSRSASSDDGFCTLAITSAAHGSPIAAPASRYSSSANAAASPAPASTTISIPIGRSRATASARAQRAFARRCLARNPDAHRGRTLSGRPDLR